MKKILITNDDGVASDGIARLARAALAYGEVWVVAPDGQRSAASHSITLHKPIDFLSCDFMVEGVHAFSCSGTPGDCVRGGCLFLMPEKPDIVLSGINYGYNAASDVQYSATVGAAFEGSFQGVPSVALSESATDCHEVTDAYIEKILGELMEYRFCRGEILNVNFPGIPLSECKGVLRNRRVSGGMFYRDSYDVVGTLPDGGVRLMVNGEYNEDAEKGTDFRAIVDGYISIGTVRNVG